MRTLEQHRYFILEWIDSDDVKQCIAQVEHAISISVRALMEYDCDPSRYAHMKGELEMELQILRELEERVSDGNTTTEAAGVQDQEAVPGVAA